MSAGTIVREPSTAMLRKHHGRVEAMMLDRDLSGELLLVALAFARLVDFRPKPWRIADVAEHLWPIPAYAHGPAAQIHAERRVKTVLLSDRRRYDPPLPQTTCPAPVRGRDTPCGRPGGAAGATLYDVCTGDETRLVTCARHANWLRARHADNVQACALNPPPSPRANAGGALVKHLPEIDWPQMWTSLDPNWTAPREPATAGVSVPPPPSSPGPPALTLIRGEGKLPAAHSAPALTLVKT